MSVSSIRDISHFQSVRYLAQYNHYSFTSVPSTSLVQFLYSLTKSNLPTHNIIITGRRSMHLRCEGGHAEPKAFLEVEISLLLVILILLHVVLRRKEVSANLFSAEKT